MENWPLVSVDWYDRYILIASLSLGLWGLLMVASSTIEIAQRQYEQPFYYVTKQACYILLSIGIAIVIVQIPIALWQRIAVHLLLISVIGLILVLIPGIGKAVNGSRRWLILGPLRLQVSELIKLTAIIYMARYLSRFSHQITNQIHGFLRPMALLGCVTILLLQEPDLGAALVLLVTSLGMLFLAGPKLIPFIGLLVSMILGVLGIVMSSSYRLTRLTSFIDPWSHPLDSGYQLTQALVALGRGGWCGVGLGESVQKLFYLPEAHTDFIFAVLVEELGLIGGLLLMGLFTIIISRALHISWQCQQSGKRFATWLSFGIGTHFAFSVMVNLGVNMGLLPTKGLALPFISYGGSSLLVSSMMIAILLRIDYESRLSRLRR